MQSRTCQNCKKEFIIEEEDFNFYEKIKVPPPTFCPECRLQRRMSWRNERTLHRNKCAKTGKNLVSCFSADLPFVIYERDVWWSDDWDSGSFGKDYDFLRPFFSQFRTLMEKVPLPNLFIGKCVNTSFGNYIGEFKNAYLVSASWMGENITYGSRCNGCKDCLDMFSTNYCQFSYEDVSAVKCYETFFSQNVDSCTSSYFLYDCKNCINCFGCTNLRNKSNCMWNKQLTKEEYLKEFEKLNIGSYKNLNEIKKRFEELKISSIRKFATITNSVNVSGDGITHATNSFQCFDVFDGIKDCKFLINSLSIHDSYDGYGVGANSELIYEAMDSGINASRQLFCLTVWECMNATYSWNCHGCNNIFGCIGLRNKNYCILNKQYTKEEYEKLLPQIIDQMNNLPYIDKRGIIYKYGEYFPAEISPFGYNETVAEDYFVLSKEEILANGYNYTEREKPEYQITTFSKDLLDDIKDIDEEVLNSIIECNYCFRPYKIVLNEFLFLKKFNLPIPRKCYECRHQERFKKVNPLRLWHRKCMKEGCNNEFETSYAPDRPEIVYCEKCYQQEVY